MEPLAYRLRPQRLDDIFGQDHLIGPYGPIRKMIKIKKLTSLILYGSPGIGKTTLALTIVKEMNLPYQTFNASTDNKQALKDVIELAKMYERFILIVDEIHRMKKDIQDYLLPFVEMGQVILIGLTTINPYHSVNPAIRSRTLIFKLNELTQKDLEKITLRALKQIDENLTIDNDALEFLSKRANGDVRFLLNCIEGISYIIDNKNITIDDVKAIVQKPSVAIDKNEDNYYDTLSGLQKSIRGSDVDASLHYLAKLLVADDLLPLVRRLSVIAYEDIGLANPSIGPRVKAACEVALEVGMPEARIPLSAVVCEMALSPKSNSAYLAIDKALADIENGKTGPLPKHLRNPSDTYLYPHDYPGAWVYQQYLPDNIKDVRYYEPKTTSKYEQALKERYDAIEKAKKNQ